MPVTCALYSWEDTSRHVFVTKFDQQPTTEDVQHLVDVIPELTTYRLHHPRLIGIYDLQGHKPANALSVLLHAQDLFKYRRLLSSIVLVNSAPGASLADMLEQINFFANQGVFILKHGSQEQQEKDLVKVAEHDENLARLVKDYLTFHAHRPKSGPFTLIEELIGKYPKN